MKTHFKNVTSFLSTILVCGSFSAYGMDDPEFSVSLTNDMSQVLQGGLNDEEFSFRTQAIVAYDQEYTNYVSGHVSFVGLFGDNGSANLGDIQAYSNIDTDEFTGLYEAWLRFEPSKRTFIKVGQIDANADFALPENSGNFLNSSYGYSPTIGYLVSYPKPSTGIVTSFELGNRQQIKIGGFAGDGNEFDKPFFIAEVSQSFDAVKFKFGAWFQNEEVRVFAHEPEDIFNPDTQRDRRVFRSGDDGFYIVLDGTYQKLDWFVQYGHSDSDTQVISNHLGGGISIKNVLTNNPDEFGAGITYARLSSDFNRTVEPALPSGETVLEVYYQYELNKYVTFKPDLQYIKNPASQPGLEDALVFTLRTTINF